MQVELEPEEIELLVEALDCLKTKIAFTKGLPSAEKNAGMMKADALEAKLRAGETSRK